MSYPKVIFGYFSRPQFCWQIRPPCSSSAYLRQVICFNAGHWYPFLEKLILFYTARTPFTFRHRASIGGVAIPATAPTLPFSAKYLGSSSFWFWSSVQAGDGKITFEVGLNPFKKYSAESMRGYRLVRRKFGVGRVTLVVTEDALYDDAERMPVISRIARRVDGDGPGGLRVYKRRAS